MIGTLLFWVVFGGLTGWIASIMVGTNKDQGILGNIAVGIIGAMVGGFVFRAFGGDGVTGFNLYSVIVAIVGAALTLFVIRAVFGRSTSR